jgi:hypothetical protein
MEAARKICGARERAAGVLGHWRRRSRRDPRKQDVRDRLVEDAGILLLIIGRQQISYDGALDGLVRDAFWSADRLRAAAAEARASGRPDAELDLLERAVERAVHGPPPEVPRPELRPGAGQLGQHRTLGTARGRTCQDPLLVGRVETGCPSVRRWPRPAGQ